MLAITNAYRRIIKIIHQCVIVALRNSFFKNFVFTKFLVQCLTCDEIKFHIVVLLESALLNLSLLTGDFWSVIFTVFKENIIPKPLFWLALILIVLGVIFYETVPSPMYSSTMGSDCFHDVQKRKLCDDCEVLEDNHEGDNKEELV